MWSPSEILGANWLGIVLGLAVCAAFSIYARWIPKSKGPIGLPYLGYYPFLSDLYHFDLDKLAKKYGEVFCFVVTGQTYVNLGSMRAFKEANITKAHHFADRPKNYTFMLDTFGTGFGLLNTEKWMVLRKFLVHQLKEHGMGKRTQENLMLECLQKTIDSMKQSQNKNLDALTFFRQLCSDVIWGLIASGAKVDDRTVQTFNDAYAIAMDSMVGKKILLSGPLLQYVLMPLVPKYRNYLKYNRLMESLIAKIVRDHEEDYDKDSLKDLIDFFIHERKTLEGKGDPKAEIYSENALVSSLIQIFGDGALSISYFVSLLLKDLAQRPEVQKKIQQEVDEGVGRNRFPSWDDRNKLTYTNAVIYEILRHGSLVPAFPSLECTKPTTVCGCYIPKGAVTVMNFWSALHDPEVFDEPFEFDPSRYLHTDDKKPKSELPTVFGVGKRACIGEALVNMEAFLFVTAVLQHFDLSPATTDDQGSTHEKGILPEFSLMFRVSSRTV